MRVGLADLSAMAGRSDDTNEPAPQDNQDTVYYLRTSTPHLHDITMSGPYTDLQEVHNQANHNFGTECEPGQNALQEFVRDGRPIGFIHISSPINGDPNKTRRIELIRRTNAELAARFPCPVWNVVVSEPLLTAAGEPQPGAFDGVAMKSVDVHGSYFTKPAAMAAARKVLDDLLRRSPGCTIRDVSSTSDNTFMHGAIIGPRNRSMEWIVHVRYDSGTVFL